MSKLSEKFEGIVYPYIGSSMLTNEVEESVIKANSEICAEIAKEFAVGFGLFLRTKCITTDYLQWFYNGKYYLETELLEIYIKEKGL